MNRIKQLRKEKGLTLQQVADGLTARLSKPKFDLQQFSEGGSSKQGKKPIAKSTVLRWENEKNSPTAEMWGLLADYFGVSVDYLKGAWSKKEVLELMSSSLLDNYDRVHELALEYCGGEGEEWRFFDEIDIESTENLSFLPGSHEVYKIKKSIAETNIINELRKNYFEGLAFAILHFVYYRGVCRNFHTEEHFKLDKSGPNGELTDENIAFFNYPKIQGYKNIQHFMMNFYRKRNVEERLTFLDTFFHEYDDNSILEDAVVNKIMQEKAPAETMALVLTSVIEAASRNLSFLVGSEERVYNFLASRQQYKDLSNEFDELQKENDRLKAELASK
ncbi:helix-turn-helix domain-containing protein [Lactobacillus delbrueckii]|uniref:helix-turn-helix domain-containing protein n=1 Tax=Lactobacillus delbrueckii TaxID=1584 RepID=UPI0022E46AF7|nr:helix-turn-helix transcriptional regulator [Lactobacillus delbrueckii]